MDVVSRFVENVTEIDVVQYWRSTLPGQDDGQMFEVLFSLYKGTLDDRFFAFELVDTSTANILAVFSERMASLALSERSHDCLVIGLFSLAASFNRETEDEANRLLAVYVDVARKLEVDLDVLFARILVKIPESQKKYLDGFLKLNNDEQLLERFNFIAKASSNGLMYRRLC